jgi:hypothetical protein
MANHLDKRSTSRRLVANLPSVLNQEMPVLGGEVENLSDRNIQVSGHAWSLGSGAKFKGHSLTLAQATVAAAGRSSRHPLRMDAEGAVGAFSDTLRRLLASTAVEPAWIVREVNGGRLPSSGDLGGVQYEKHGFGVRFTDSDGTEVDVDGVIDDALDGVFFDSWRIRMFVVSTGEEPPSLDSIEAALERAVARGEMSRPTDKWLTLG